MEMTYKWRCLFSNYVFQQFLQVWVQFSYKMKNLKCFQIIRYSIEATSDFLHSLNLISTSKSFLYITNERSINMRHRPFISPLEEIFKNFFKMAQPVKFLLGLYFIVWLHNISICCIVKFERKIFSKIYIYVDMCANCEKNRLKQFACNKRKNTKYEFIIDEINENYALSFIVESSPRDLSWPQPMLTCLKKWQRSMESCLLLYQENATLNSLVMLAKSIYTRRACWRLGLLDLHRRLATFLI